MGGNVQRTARTPDGRTLRGCDVLWSMWQWLDRAPLGRNEQGMSWFRRHDEYDPDTSG
jgi:predicted dithiol-disulfide oxidoreductase (DUF899 family)